MTELADLHAYGIRFLLTGGGFVYRAGKRSTLQRRLPGFRQHLWQQLAPRTVSVRAS